MKNAIERGEFLIVPAPAGGVISGQLVIIGQLIGIAESTQPAGVNVSVVVVGVHELPKVSAQAWTQGQSIYWDSTAGNATTVATGNTLIGYASEAAANPSSVGRVLLCPRGA